MQEQNKNQKPASRASGVKKPAPKKPAPKKKDPLWERALIALFSGLLALDDAFKQSAVRVIEFYIELFTGFPAAISYLRAKRKKKRAAVKRAKKEKKRLRDIEKAEKKTDAKSEKAKKKAEEKEEKKARRKERRRVLITRVPTLLLAAVIVFEVALFAVGGGLYLYKTLTSGSGAITMSVVIGKNSVSTSLPGDYALESDGERPCFDMTFLAKQLGILAYGNGKDVLYTLPGGQKLNVRDGSNTVYIDGTPLSLKSAARFNGERIYISIELLLNYADGVGVNYDKDAGRLTILCRSASAVTLLPARIEGAEHPEIP